MTNNGTIEILHKEIESLHQQLKIQEDAANHWFTEANKDHNRYIKLEQQIADQPLSFGHWKEVFEVSINDLKQQLAESQAREKVLRDALKDYHQFRPTDISVKALAVPSDSTALDTMLKQAKREALLEAAEYLATGICENDNGDYLRNMAKELE
jgi:hypothetical protein